MSSLPFRLAAYRAALTGQTTVAASDDSDQFSPATDVGLTWWVSRMLFRFFDGPSRFECSP
jgi:hypothetical protein